MSALPTALVAHLRREYGLWPPDAPLVLATSPARASPGWDGAVRPVAGVRTPQGAVLSVPADLLARLRERVAPGATLDQSRPVLEPALGGRLGEAMYRWSDAPADLPALGEWLSAEHPALPDWLRPFGGDTLVVREAGVYLAGVGMKRHDEHAWEIAVGTEEAARGRGLARRLVATAARHLLDRGIVPLYLHALDNAPSARVADAAGFPDRGWRLLFVQGADSEDG